MDTRLLLPFLSCCAFTLWQCQSSDRPDTQSAPEKPAISRLDADSIQRVYEQKLAAYPNPLPTEQIIEKNKLYPVDQAPLDTHFFLFREELLEAIARKDVFRLLEACSQNIKASFGGEDTLAEFVEMWQLDKDAENSEVWAILERVLRNGGVFEQGRQAFYAPYTYATFPDDLDAFTHGVISGEGVRLRSQPATNARIVTNLSYDVVEYLPAEEEIRETIGDETHPWVHVKTVSGQEGWVYGKYYASPIDFRAGFERQADGRWEMVFLVAGD